MVDLVRTITFRISVKAADYEKALKPEVWPYRVSVRHYRAPRRPASASTSGWRGQSSMSGGTINPDSGSNSGVAHNNAPQNIRHPTGNKHHLPPGHPGRLGPQQQLMSPIEVSNFWNTLSSLASSGGDLGLISHP